jgi:hypothetical protein
MCQCVQLKCQGPQRVKSWITHGMCECMSVQLDLKHNHFTLPNWRGEVLGQLQWGWLCESLALSESNTWQELLLNFRKGKDTKKYFDLCACHFNLHKHSRLGTSLLLGLHRERKWPCYQACARTRTCPQIFFVQVCKKQNPPSYMGPGFLCSPVLIFARHASVTLHRKLKLLCVFLYSISIVLKRLKAGCVFCLSRWQLCYRLCNFGTYAIINLRFCLSRCRNRPMLVRFWFL